MTLLGMKDAADNSRVYISSLHIVSLRQEGNATVIVLAYEKKEVKVKETLEQIVKALLQGGVVCECS